MPYPPHVTRRHFLRHAALAGAALATAPLASCARKLPAAAAQPTAAPKPIFGCFDAHAIQYALELNAHAVRLIMPIGILQKLISQARQAQAGRGAMPWFFSTLRAMHHAGIKTVVTFLWVPHWMPSSKAPPLPPPHSPRAKAWLATARDFVQMMGENLYCVTMDNEPLTYLHPVDWRPSSAGSIPVLNWYSYVADEIHSTTPNLPIAAPAINILQQTMAMTPQRLKLHPWVKQAALHMHQMCDWANRSSHISALDLHLYVKTAAQMQPQLAFAGALTDKPFLVTEWSQLPVLRGWINEPLNLTFAKHWNLHGHGRHLTNSQYCSDCLRQPVSVDQWNDFVATAPLAPNFIADCYQIMCQNRVRLCTYTGCQQYNFPGYASYDIPTLYANATVMSVNGKWQLNTHLAQPFKAIASMADT